MPFFEAHYGLPTTLFDMDQRLFPPSPMSLQPQAGLVMPVALGLASRQLSRRALGLDFRQEEFALRKSYDESAVKLLSLGGMVALLVGLSLFDLYYHLRTKKLSWLCSNIRWIPFSDLSRGATGQQCSWPRAGEAPRDRGQPEGRWHPQWAAGLGIRDAA